MLGDNGYPPGPPLSTEQLKRMRELASKRGEKVAQDLDEFILKRIKGMATKDDWLTDEEKKIVTERTKQYGNYEDNFRDLACLWRPILEHHADLISEGHQLPNYVVALMMALAKIARIGPGGKYHKDNYADAVIYLKFAQDLHEAVFELPSNADEVFKGVTKEAIDDQLSKQRDFGEIPM